jgi:drug/metabolite transporter (DMT)-like permease
VPDAEVTSASSTDTPARVHLVLLIVQLAFATLAVEGKLAMGPAHGVSPKALAMARVAGGAAVFIAIELTNTKRKLPSAPDVVRLAALSLLGIVLNQALFLLGLKATSPVSATLLVATIPVFSAVIAVAAKRDQLSLRGAAGIALALFGILVLTHFALPRGGDALVLLNSLCYAFYVVYAKGVLQRYGAMTVMAWIFGLGALMFAPFGGADLAAEFASWPLATRGLVLFIVLVPTVIAYLGNAWALARARPTLVTIYVYVQPLVVALLVWVQFDQRLDVWAIAAGLLIFAGVGIVATARRPRASLVAQA